MNAGDRVNVVGLGWVNVVEDRIFAIAVMHNGFEICVGREHIVDHESAVIDNDTAVAVNFSSNKEGAQ